MTGKNQKSIIKKGKNFKIDLVILLLYFYFLFYGIMCQVDNLCKTFMRELLNKFQPLDIIAIITIIGGLFLKFSGADGVVGTILTVIVASYFGKKEVLDPIVTKKISNSKIETVEQAIRRIAKDQGCDADLAVRVAKCESGLNPVAKNKNDDGSIDRGLYQWNNHWHPEITDSCAYNIECSTRAFCKAFIEGHLNWWNATKKCWDI